MNTTLASPLSKDTTYVYKATGQRLVVVRELGLQLRASGAGPMNQAVFPAERHQEFHRLLLEAGYASQS